MFGLDAQAAALMLAASALVRFLQHTVRPVRPPRSRRRRHSGAADVCGDVQDGLYPCFQGLALRTGPPLTLFRAPPRIAGPAPEVALLADGDRALLALAALFTPTGAGEALSYEASSDSPALLSVRIDRGRLVLDANDEGAEGVAAITVTATVTLMQANLLTLPSEYRAVQQQGPLRRVAGPSSFQNAQAPRRQVASTTPFSLQNLSSR